MIAGVLEICKTLSVGLSIRFLISELYCNDKGQSALQSSVIKRILGLITQDPMLTVINAFPEQTPYKISSSPRSQALRLCPRDLQLFDLLKKHGFVLVTKRIPRRGSSQCYHEPNPVLHPSTDISQTVLITGGSRGLGLAAACQLAAKGANVAIGARDPEVLKEALAEVEKSARSSTQRFFSLTADVTKAAECARVISEVTAWNEDTPPDVVWCCSGSAHPTLFVDTPVEQLQTMMDSNYFSSAYMAHATLNAWLRPALDGVAKKSAESKSLPARHIIFTGSFVSLYSFAGFTPYSPSKAAIRSLSDSLSQEMNLYAGAHPDEPRVRIHTVFPATMPTKSLDDENRVKTDVTKALEEGDQILKPDECARRAIAGLENGEELIATSTIIRLVMTTVMGGAIRGGFWTGLINTMLSWVVMIVMVFIRWDMDVKVRNWGKKHGASGKAS